MNKSRLAAAAASLLVSAGGLAAAIGTASAQPSPLPLDVDVVNGTCISTTLLYTDAVATETEWGLLSAAAAIDPALTGTTYPAGVIINGTWVPSGYLIGSYSSWPGSCVPASAVIASAPAPTTTTATATTTPPTTTATTTPASTTTTGVTTTTTPPSTTSTTAPATTTTTAPSYLPGPAITSFTAAINPTNHAPFLFWFTWTTTNAGTVTLSGPPQFLPHPLAGLPANGSRGVGVGVFPGFYVFTLTVTPQAGAAPGTPDATQTALVPVL